MIAPRRLGSQSRQTSSNSEGNNRESSLDDSGVVDDHEDADVTSEDVATHVPNLIRVSGDPCPNRFKRSAFVYPESGSDASHGNAKSKRNKSNKVQWCW